jgi:predicted DNA repair protein MutK
LIGLLDEIAALAKLSSASLDDVSDAAGRATAKAAGVVVDDTAVTRQYLPGVAAERGPSILKRIVLATVFSQGFWLQLASLMVVSFVITILVCGVGAEVCK